MVLKVQDQPQFEAGIGDGEFDAALAGTIDSTLSNLGGFVGHSTSNTHQNSSISPSSSTSSAAGLDRHGDESFGDGSPVSGFNSEIDGSHVAYRWLSLQSVQILGLGSFPFAEDQERLSWLANRNSTFEGPFPSCASS